MSYYKNKMAALYNKYNAELFDGVLPPATTASWTPGRCSITITGRMTSIYGNAWRKGNWGGTPDSYRIGLAKRLFTNERLRHEEQPVKTLLHEMVHIWTYLYPATRACGHGSAWQVKWVEVGRRFDLAYPGRFDFSMEEHADRQNVHKYGGPSRVADAIAAETAEAMSVDHGRVDLSDERIKPYHPAYRRAVCPCCYQTYFRKRFAGAMRDCTELGRRKPNGRALGYHLHADGESHCDVPLQIID